MSALQPSPSLEPTPGPPAGPPRLTPGEAELVAIFVQMSQTLALPPSLGEIYGLLFASTRPLAQQDIMDRLQISKGSVSQGLRFLRTIGAIQSVPHLSDRRECFEPVVELRALVGGFIRERITPQLSDWGTRTQNLSLDQFQVPGAPPLPASELALINARLGKLQTWQSRAELVLPLMGKLIG